MEKGSKHTEESKAKIKEKRRLQYPEPKAGTKLSDESKRKISESKKGTIVSEETRRKLSLAKMGNKNMVGKKLPLETKIKMSCTVRGIPIEEFKQFARYEDYCHLFNHPFKERVREFFGRKCVNCGKLEADCKYRLSVHHVEFDKETCCHDGKPLFVALCNSCHSKTNGNREYWKDYYLNIVINKYNSKCYYTKEEYAEVKRSTLTQSKNNLL
jgi:hypothetical protein